MEDLKKVNGIEFYMLWKNLSISLLVVIGVIAMSRMLPNIMSPLLALLGAAFLYTLIYNNRMDGSKSCMIAPYSIFVCFIVYTVISVVCNLLWVWHMVKIPDEFLFLTDPFIPSLLMMPVFFLTMLVIYFRGHNLALCVKCRMRNGDPLERGRMGAILLYETNLQIINLIIIFGLTAAIVWAYYLVFYITINVNNRDWYVFVWAIVIIFFLDEIYFIYRYYNLYLDLKENNEVIDAEELDNIESRTYLRFYVICGNHIYVDPHSFNPDAPFREIIDTPFFTKRSVNGISIDEVRRTIVNMTGVDNGELRFFFGRRVQGHDKLSILRYFYFIDGDIKDHEHLRTTGEWMDFERIKQIYSNTPQRMAPLNVTDITRLATIILTEKTYDARGNRKSKIKSYTPSFNLLDVRRSNIDFQDEQWIEIAMLNADTPFFRLKRWWRAVSGRQARRRSYR